MTKNSYVLSPLTAALMAVTAMQSATAAEVRPPLSMGEKTEVVNALAAQLKAKYVFPDVAERVAKALADKAAKGGYASAGTEQAFAEQLTKDLQDLGKDKHFRVGFMPGFKPEPDDDTAATPQQVAEAREGATKQAYGIARVERLPGNVGYLDLRSFEQIEFVAPAYSSAMSLLSGTDALILDLRRNGGGEPASVAYLLSHFFAQGDSRHLNDIYNKPKNTTREYWTDPSVGVRYVRPVYILTSNYTFSGGEECAYDFQTQKRATLVGETTGGGANPGDMVPLTHDFNAFVPTGRAINPITHTNWEHIGVKPDVQVPASQAEQWAYADILRKIVIPNEKVARKVDALTALLAKVEKGENVTEFAPHH